MGRKNPAEELDIFASPEKNGDRKPRRNSESSVLDKPPTSEEERRRRERHRRERRHDGSRSRHGRRKPHGLDIIDKLDVTGIYGAGRESSDFDCTDSNPHICPIVTTNPYPFIPAFDISIMTYLVLLQYSITTVRLTPAIRTATARKTTGRPCRRFPKTRQTWRWVAQARSTTDST